MADEDPEIVEVEVENLGDNDNENNNSANKKEKPGKCLGILIFQVIGYTFKGTNSWVGSASN